VDILSVSIEHAVESSQDHERAKAIREAVGGYHFEDILGSCFLSQLQEAKLFRINFLQPERNEELLDKEYDALIKLSIEELSLIKRTYNLKVLAKVSGKMVDLRDSEIIWSQHEIVMSNDEYSLAGEHSQFFVKL
jgi:hypothetical protein